MKSVIMAAFLLAAGNGFCQDNKRVIQQGNVIDYTVYTGVGAVGFIATLAKANEETVTIEWVMMGSGGSGLFRMGKASLDSARLGYWNQPINGEELTLDDERTLLCLSKACWNDIVQNKPMAFGSAKYLVKQRSVPYKAGNNTVDCVYLESEDKGSFLWIANNEKLPMILKTESNPDGVNVELTAIR